MKDPATPPQYLTKVEAAKRQLKCAIELFFNLGDAVAVHTLAGAVVGLTDPLLKTIGKPSLIEEMFADRGGDYICESYKTFKQFVNWFKHADRDASAKIVFHESYNDFVLWWGTKNVANLIGDMTFEMQVLDFWFISMYLDKGEESSQLNYIRRMLPDIQNRPRWVQKGMGAALFSYVRSEPFFFDERQREIHRQILSD